MSGWGGGWDGGWDGGWQGPVAREGSGALQAQAAQIFGLGERWGLPTEPETGDWAVLQPWALATRGTFCGPWGQATQGIFCETAAIGEPPRWIIGPGPEEPEKPDRRRRERDMKDLSDILDMLGHLVT